MSGEKKKRCIAILSPLKRHCGNTIHALRLQNAVVSCGYECLVQDPAKLTVQLFKELITDNNVVMAIGIHALHSGRILKDCHLPFGIVLSGTDVNGWYTNSADQAIMTATISKASYALTLTQAGIDQASNTWPQVKGKISRICHGVKTNPSNFCLRKYCQQNGSSMPQCALIFGWIGGIRPVKDPLFVVQAFSDYCSLYGEESPNTFLCIIGPVLDEEYFPKFKSAIEEMANVVYIPGLPVEDIHAIVTQCCFVINTSVAEGCSQAILEACLLGVPVMVRRNPGNMALITNNETGLVFSSKQECVGHMRLLVTDSELRQQLADNAHHMIKTHHSIEQERATIRDFIDNVIGSDDRDGTNMAA